MHKKILYGIISVAALSMITGCGSKASDGANNVNTTEVINTQDSQDTNSESEDSYMDSEKSAWVLRKEFTDKQILDELSGVAMFADNLTLPIDINTLMDYPAEAVGIEQGKLSSIVDSYTDTFTFEEFTIYDKTGSTYSYLPDLVLGKEDSEEKITVKQAITDGNWKLGPSMVTYETVGLTEDEYNSICNENPDKDGLYIIADKIYDRLGTPNYIGWYCDSENSTQYGKGYDAKAYLNMMRDPGKYGSDGVTSYETIVGWQFDSYGIALDISETSDNYGGDVKSSVYSVVISYIPATYGTIEDECGTNAIADFLAAK